LAGATALAALLALVLPGLALAGGPGVWTKLATVNNSADTVGMVRTGDGQLHLVWAKQASNKTWAYGTATITEAGKLLATGTALSGWTSLETDPQLVPYGTGERLIFEGYKGTTGCFFDGVVFTETSTNGSTWSLVQGSLDAHTVGVGNLAATTESDGTPVAVFADGAAFHVGVDPNCPATSADGTIPVATGNSPSNVSTVTASDGSIWVATFQAFSNMGYFVTRILPTAGPLIKVPGSTTNPAHNNQPDEPVALAARPGGGVYMAFCVSNSSQPCVHIDLWREGSSKPIQVPGSANTTAGRVALTATPQGRLWVTWYDGAKNLIHSVRTNTAGTSFGAVTTIKPPPHMPATDLSDLQTQGSSGRLDIIVNAMIQVGTTYPVDLFHTQILPGLSLHASPRVFSHTKAATVTFTVADAGQPVAGAKVACPGKSGTTTAAGQAKLHFSKGTAKGFHVCTATKPGYNSAKVTLKVT
jgi:hypothetical protein